MLFWTELELKLFSLLFNLLNIFSVTPYLLFIKCQIIAKNDQPGALNRKSAKPEDIQFISREITGMHLSHIAGTNMQVDRSTLNKVSSSVSLVVPAVRYIHSVTVGFQLWHETALWSVGGWCPP